MTLRVQHEAYKRRAVDVEPNYHYEIPLEPAAEGDAQSWLRESGPH